MEHFNPLLLHNDSPAKFITIGEVMLRLTPPNYEKIRMASNFEASYGGSEANIALALANLGVDSTFFIEVERETAHSDVLLRQLAENPACPAIIEIARAAADQLESLRGVRHYFGVPAVFASVVFGRHVSAAAPVFVAYSPELHVVRSGMTVFGAQLRVCG